MEIQEAKIKMQLACPMPKLDFDVITLGHGSGGLLTNKLLDSGVFDLLKNDHLARRHDGAVIELSGNTAFTTDSFVVNPIFFPGGDIGDLAVNGTVNDLAMCGAIPQYLSLSFIIEEGLRMEEFWKILVSIKYACDVANVEVVTGDTKVVERGKGDKIFINTTGIGLVHKRANIHSSQVKAGDRIILSGQLANHGIAIMSLREGFEFESEIRSDTRPLHHLVKAMLDEFGEDIHLLRDPTRGGLASTMIEVARDAKLGLEVLESQIPIDSQVEGACEILGLDPLYVANEGVFTAIVDASIAEVFCSKLQSFDEGSYASIIGTVVEEHPGQVLLKSKIGGKRVVNMSIGEQLPRIC